MPIIYHIAPAGNWPPEHGDYRGETLDNEGFIHCSTAEQLFPVANRLFRGRDALIVLVIDETRVRSEIIYENLEGGREPFPHIYGPLEPEAVIATFALMPSAHGTFTTLDDHPRW